MQLGRFPRFRMGHLPTPLEDLPRLTKMLSGPRIMVKRDDCTGLALGGSKARSLEFLLGAALAEGADCVVTLGPVQSNHARMTAAAARKAGLECVLLLQGERPAVPQGNLLLEIMSGAKIHLFEKASLADLDNLMLELVGDLRKRGRKPYAIPGGGYSPTGALGYVDAMLELAWQLNNTGTGVDALVLASGSGCAQSGLLVGAKALRSGLEVIGITVNRTKESLCDRVLQDARALVDRLEINLDLQPEDVHVQDRYIGQGYGIPTQGCLEAIDMAARMEGLLLDPTYTAKAMAGLIDLVRTGYFRPGQTVVFLHTGGLPGLFTRPELLTLFPESGHAETSASST